MGGSIDTLAPCWLNGGPNNRRFGEKVGETYKGISWIVFMIRLFCTSLVLTNSIRNTQIIALADAQDVKSTNARHATGATGQVDDLVKTPQRVNSCNFGVNSARICQLYVEGNAELYIPFDPLASSIDIIARSSRTNKEKTRLRIGAESPLNTNINDVIYSIKDKTLGVAPLTIELEDYYEKSRSKDQDRFIVLTSTNSRSKQVNTLFINVRILKDNEKLLLVISNAINRNIDTSSNGHGVKFLKASSNKKIQYSNSVAIRNTDGDNVNIIANIEPSLYHGYLSVVSKNVVMLNKWRLKNNNYKLIVTPGRNVLTVINPATRKVLTRISLVTRNPWVTELGWYSAETIGRVLPSSILLLNIAYGIKNTGCIDMLYTAMLLSIAYTPYIGYHNNRWPGFVTLIEWIYLRLSQHYQILVDSNDESIYHITIVATQLLSILVLSTVGIFCVLMLVLLSRVARMIMEHTRYPNEFDVYSSASTASIIWFTIKSMGYSVCRRLLILEAKYLAGAEEHQDLAVPLVFGYFSVITANLWFHLQKHRIIKVSIMGNYVEWLRFLVLLALGVITVCAISTFCGLFSIPNLIKKWIIGPKNNELNSEYDIEVLDIFSDKFQGNYTVLSDGCSTVDPRETKQKIHILDDKHKLEYKLLGVPFRNNGSYSVNIPMRVVRVFEGDGNAGSGNTAAYRISKYFSRNKIIGHACTVIPLNGNRRRAVAIKSDLSIDRLKVATLMNNYFDAVIHQQDKFQSGGTMDVFTSADDTYKGKLREMFFSELFVIPICMVWTISTRLIGHFILITVLHLILILLWLSNGFYMLSRDAIMNSEANVNSQGDNDQSGESCMELGGNVPSQQTKFLILRALKCFFSLVLFLLIGFYKSRNITGLLAQLFTIPLINCFVNTSWSIDQIYVADRCYNASRRLFKNAAETLKSLYRFLKYLATSGLDNKWTSYIPRPPHLTTNISALNKMGLDTSLYPLLPEPLLSSCVDVNIYDVLGFKYQPAVPLEFKKLMFLHPKVSLKFGDYRSITLTKEWFGNRGNGMESRLFALIETCSTHTYGLINAWQSLTQCGNNGQEDMQMIPIYVNMPSVDQYKDTSAHKRLTSIDYDRQRNLVSIYGTFINPREVYTVTIVAKDLSEATTENEEVVVNVLCTSDGQLTFLVQEEIEEDGPVSVAQIMAPKQFTINENNMTIDAESGGYKICIYHFDFTFGFEYTVTVKPKRQPAAPGDSLTYELSSDSILSKIDIPIELDPPKFNFYSYNYQVINTSGVMQTTSPRGRLPGKENNFGIYCSYVFTDRTGSILFEDAEYGFCTTDKSRFTLKNDYIVYQLEDPLENCSLENTLGESFLASARRNTVSNLTFRISNNEYMINKNMHFSVPVTIVGKINNLGVGAGYYRVVPHYTELARELSNRVVKLQAYVLHLTEHNGLGLARIAAEFFTRSDLLDLFNQFSKFQDDKGYQNILEEALVAVLNIALRYCIAHINDFIAVLLKLHQLQQDSRIRLLMDRFDRLTAIGNVSIPEIASSIIEQAMHYEMNNDAAWNLFLFPFAVKESDIHPRMCINSTVSRWCEDISAILRQKTDFDCANHYTSLILIGNVLKRQLMQITSISHGSKSNKNIDFCHILIPRLNQGYKMEHTIVNHFGFIQAHLSKKKQSTKAANIANMGENILWIPCIVSQQGGKLSIKISARVTLGQGKDKNTDNIYAPSAQTTAAPSLNTTQTIPQASFEVSVLRGRCSRCIDYMMALNMYECRDMGTLVELQTSKSDESRRNAMYQNISYDFTPKGSIVFRFSDAKYTTWELAVEEINKSNVQQH